MNQLWDDSIDRAIAIQDSSHTPPGAFGYLLSQIDPRPQLTVATHFPVSDDTVACAMKSVRNHVPDIGDLGERLTFEAANRGLCRRPWEHSPPAAGPTCGRPTSGRPGSAQRKEGRHAEG